MMDALLPLVADESLRQAERAADAGWETARWTFWLFIATVALFIAAVAAATYAALSWKAANGELKLAIDAIRKQEASNVHAWLAQPRPDGDITVCVQNYNKGPVYNVKAEVLIKRPSDSQANEVLKEESVAVYPQSRGPELVVIRKDGTVEGTYAAIRNTADGKGKPPLTKGEWAIWDGKESTAGLQVRISFKDSASRHWTRGWNGDLSEDTSSEPMSGATASKPLSGNPA